MLEIKQKPHHRVVRSSKKLSPLFRALQKLMITCLILGVILVGAGMAYSWYNSKYGGSEVAVATLKKPTPSRQPTKPSQTGQIGASLQSISSPIAPGDNASITVHTNADANCTIAVVYNKVPAKDSGLAPKKADELGLVTWGWTVPATTPVGKWPVTVTCANLKKSGVVSGDLVVTKTPAQNQLTSAN